MNQFHQDLFSSHIANSFPMDDNNLKMAVRCCKKVIGYGGTTGWQ